jgi:hypothetical protein
MHQHYGNSVRALMRRQLPGFLLAIILLLSGRAESQTGWVIVELNSNPYGLMSMQSTFIQGNRIRIDNNETIIILDLEAGDISLIYPTRMVFWKGKPAEFREGMIRTVELQISSAIEMLPAHERDIQRRELDQMISLMSSDSLQTALIEGINIKATGQKDTIAGTLAHCYEVYVDTVLYEKVWVSRDIHPFNNIDLATMQAMSRELTKPSIVSAYRESPDFLKLIEGGFVMRSVLPTPIGESVTQVESYRNINIRPELFLPPIDYRPAALVEVIQMGTMPSDGLKPPGME